MSKEDNQKVYFGDKKLRSLRKRIESIFSKVSDNYDLMNDLMSVGTHRIWKKHFVDTAGIQKDDTILDLAAGTRDIAKKLTKFVSKRQFIYDQNKEMIDKAIEDHWMRVFTINTTLTFPVLKICLTKIITLTMCLSFGFETFRIKIRALKR